MIIHDHNDHPHSLLMCQSPKFIHVPPVQGHCKKHTWLGTRGVLLEHKSMASKLCTLPVPSPCLWLSSTRALVSWSLVSCFSSSQEFHLQMQIAIIAEQLTWRKHREKAELASTVWSSTKAWFGPSSVTYPSCDVTGFLLPCSCCAVNQSSYRRLSLAQVCACIAPVLVSLIKLHQLPFTWYPGGCKSVLLYSWWVFDFLRCRN